jgi:hypothetical protein
MDDNGDTTMTLEQMTTTGCNKAMKACVDQLTELGWSKDEILDSSDCILQVLRDECKASLDGAMREFTEAMEVGASKYAPIGFALEFVLAGNRVARRIDAGMKAGAEEARQIRVNMAPCNN